MNDEETNEHAALVQIAEFLREMFKKGTITDPMLAGLIARYDRIKAENMHDQEAW